MNLIVDVRGTELEHEDAVYVIWYSKTFVGVCNNDYSCENMYIKFIICITFYSRKSRSKYAKNKKKINTLIVTGNKDILFKKT